jgi:hypothetical protein
MRKYVYLFSLFYSTLLFIAGTNHLNANGPQILNISLMALWPLTVMVVTTSILKHKDKQDT